MGPHEQDLLIDLVEGQVFKNQGAAVRTFRRSMDLHD